MESCYVAPKDVSIAVQCE